MGILDEITQSQNSALAAPGSYGFTQQANAQNLANQGQIAQTATANTDLQAKQRAMQLSMLSGVLNEPDPDKQRQILGNIVPIANKLNPSYQIDPNIDIPTVRALVQSQITPTEQATLQNQRANAQLLAGIKSESIEKDPMTGQLVRVNKLTGEKSPLTAQDAAQYQATGVAPQSGGTGILPQQNPSMQAPVENPQPQQAPAQPAFGFPLSSYANDLPAMRAAQKNTAQIEANKEQKAQLVNDIRTNISQLEPELQETKGGGYNAPALKVGNFFGTDQGLAADAAATNTQGLALNLSKLQQIGSSGRTTVAALQTLLNSKPDPYGHYQKNNLDNLAHIKGTVENYDAENNFLLAYKDANPMHLVDDNAYKLYDALQKQFPITTVDKSGHTTFNPQNVQALNAAIPDALANPQKYMGAQNAASQANESLKQPEQQSNVPKAGAVEDGYVFMGGDPSKPESWKPVQSQTLDARQKWLNKAEGK